MSDQGDWIDEIVAGLPALVTSAEVADILRMSPRNVTRLMAIGRLHYVQQANGGSSRRLVPRSELARYLRALEGRAA